MSSTEAELDSPTIVAMATPPGRGGIGVVRLSGGHALRIADALFPDGRAFLPRRAHYRILRGADGQRIDDAVITYFASPHSYTGEDVVEVATHGSPVVLDWLLRRCVQHGATPAGPGEFTQRAFLNGQLDLTGAEAVRDLIDAQTLGQARQAAEQMGGSIATAIRPGKRALLELIAALEAGIDFAEDDIQTVAKGELAERIHTLEVPLATLLASFTHGRVMRDGFRLAIAGEPNVGKSSLFNRLVEHDRAIVTATPGTTRDVIAERISMGGVPVELLDTAGLRETEDEAERIGVSRSREAIAEADAILVVVDAARSGLEAALGDSYPALLGRPVIVAQNKIDLRDPDSPTASTRDAFLPWLTIETSATTGAGIEELRGAILTLVAGPAQNAGSATLTNLRQQAAVTRAQSALLRAGVAAEAATPHEMILLDLYEALHALDELTGETTPDDVLHLIFSTFCIGK